MHDSVSDLVQMWWCKVYLFSTTLSCTTASFSSVESSHTIGILSLSTNRTREGQDCVVVTKCNITAIQSCVQHHESLKWKGVPYCTSNPDTWSEVESISNYSFKCGCKYNWNSEAHSMFSEACLFDRLTLTSFHQMYIRCDR